MENATLRLPVGFRFMPTDSELILSFLKPKTQSLSVPYAIPVADVNKTDPWSLPGDLNEERYFFSTVQKKYSSGTRCDRKAPSGFWKATNTDRKIFDSEKNEIGTKRTLVFYLTKRPKAMKTNWIMHEYKLTPHVQGMENWTVCRLFQKRLTARNDHGVEHEEVQNAGLGSSGQLRDFDLNLDAASSSCGSSAAQDEDISI